MAADEREAGGAGLANFVRAAAMDLAPYGIRVNSFTPTAPRPDNPELLAQWRAEGRTELRPRLPEPDRPSWWRETGTFDVRGNIPMGEPATPTDIGHCVAWLSSDYARLITGCDFVVDGGARAKYWAYTPSGDAAGPVTIPPSSTQNLEPCHGHVTTSPSSVPSSSGPPWCAQTAAIAWTAAPCRTSRVG